MSLPSQAKRRKTTHADSVLQLPGRTSLFGLPTELVLCIIDFLSPADKFILSHTCRHLRNLTFKDWPAIEKSVGTFDRAIIRHEISDSFFPKVECICGKQHFLIDRNGTLVPHNKAMARRFRRSINPIRYLSVWRLGVKELGPYLVWQMHRQGFERSYMAFTPVDCSNGTTRSDGSMKKREEYFPRSKMGAFRMHSKFNIRHLRSGEEVVILSLHVTIDDHESPEDLRGFRPCPHILVQSPLSPDCAFNRCLDRSSKSLYPAVERNSCRHCETDWEMASVAYRVVSIKIWRCFGVFKAPNDNGWERHRLPGLGEPARTGSKYPNAMPGEVRRAIEENMIIPV